ncbi:hypothetical protein EJ02DRAFT_420529 [Clathrospora elynae]|uniref:Uncharacterized protein n=1 Tax=Clathrospora elynae TaxID=706981 RepID=A0A6A5SVF6_9PLEO|nr:hypothetical protein EJ02DRAFT_420529 [Clathrospora elynae]
MSLAARLDDRVIIPTLDDWVRQPDVSARLVHFDDILLASLEPDTSSPSVRSATTVKSGSSMAPALVHQSNASTHPPSLRSYYTNTEATPTETSISTELAGHFFGVPLLEDNNGVLELPRAQYITPVYECAFWFLSCEYISPNREEWETHCMSHFRGEEPPQAVQCPLCEWAATCECGLTAWNARMHHLAIEHTMLGQTLRTSRPDFGLFQHLWRRRLIDSQDLKELNGGNHNVTSPPGNFVETNGRRRERDGRRHRTQHASAPRQPGPRRF